MSETTAKSTLVESLLEENRRLLGAVAELSLLNDLARAIGATTNTAEIMQALVNRSVKAVSAEHGSMHLVEAEEAELTGRTLARVMGSGREREPFYVKLALMGWMQINRKPLLLNEPRKDPRLAGAGWDATVKHVLCVPLLVRNELLGILTVYNKQGSEGGFTEEEGHLLEVIAGQAAPVVENARLHEEERRLRLSQEQAREESRAKSTFLASMSHELRTPLNAIIGYTEMLVEEAASDGNEGFIGDLKKIQAAAKHQLELINNILDLSKVEAGKMELFLEEFDVSDVVAEVVSMTRPVVEKRRNTLCVECAPEAGRMKADLVKLRQSLVNLLSNAAKFTDSGTVTLSVARADERLTFRVNDTGVGMDAEQIARLFQPFSQGDASTARKFGGTGLGLAITKRFTEMMGGVIEVDSEPGRGTAFTLTLPTEVAAKPEHATES